MNVLAHLYLSGDDIDLKLGNFIADSVKGSSYKSFPEGVAKGILLHRRIDTFTDNHPVFLKSLERVRSIHGKFSGVVMDLLYDHVLATLWDNYYNSPLDAFAKASYTELLRQEHLMPVKSKGFLKYMIKYDWLVAYRSEIGLAEVLSGMSRRTAYLNNMDRGVETFKKFEDEIREDFKLFFEDVQGFVKASL